MSKIITTEFKCEPDKLVLDQNYTYQKEAKSMNVNLSAISLWVRALRLERQGKTSPGKSLIPEQIEFREMKKKTTAWKWKNDILKKATALLMSYSLKILGS